MSHVQTQLLHAQAEKTHSEVGTTALVSVCLCVLVCAAFSLYDIDGDGVINGAELQTTLATLMGKAYTPSQLEQVRGGDQTYHLL